MILKLSPMVVVILLSLLGCLLPSASSLDNGLALTPPMGWLAWERFTCETDCVQNPNDCINSKLFMSMAERLAADGYKDVGYQYVNIDDCWSEMERDSDTQRLVANRTRFPDGIGGLAEYVHGLGLKLGLYGDCGTKTCAGYPAQLKSESDFEDNYFDLDAETLHDWQVDSFKFDGCYIDPLKAESICPRMSAALGQTKPILLVCEWPFYMLRVGGAAPDFALAQKSCNAWRYYEDVEDTWLSVLSIVDFSVKMQDTIVKYHGPGHWFDPDQLIIGNFALSLNQARAQMALWCIWSAPLYMSNDLRSISSESAAVLKNKDLIAINQDPMGVFGLMVAEQPEGTKTNTYQAFVKPITPIKSGCPSFAIVYLSRETLGNRKRVSFKLRELLKMAPIELAAQRYKKIQYKMPDSGEEFTFEQCSKRINSAMTRQPGSTPDLVRPASYDNGVTPIEEQSVVYDVFDLYEAKTLGRVALNSDLELEVNPSGVRAVRLVEVRE